MDLLRALLQNPSAGTQFPRSQPDAFHREPSPDDQIDDSTAIDPLDALRAVQSNYHEDLSEEIRLIGGRTLDACRVDSAAALAAHPLPSSYSQIPGLSNSSQTTLETHPPTPVALSGPRTAENIKLLYHLCQVRAVQPEFHFEQVGLRHKVSLSLANVLVEDEPGRTYGTKKEGKEVLAGKGVELVRRWQLEEARANETAAAGTLESNATSAVNKVTGLEGAAQVEAVTAWNQENWIGMLLGTLVTRATVSR